MRRLLFKKLGPLLQWGARKYFSKPRFYRYRDIRVPVLPGVFFPHFTLSTRLLLQFLEPMPLNGKTLLELGCGTGIISVLAARKGALVTAVDLNPEAVRNTALSAAENRVELNVVVSDLFAALPGETFNYIVINPPYYPKDPITPADHAWYCGAGFEYFRRLFMQLPSHVEPESQVFMILSEDCDIHQIRGIAEDNGWELQELLRKRAQGEWNYIFSVHNQHLFRS